MDWSLGSGNGIWPTVRAQGAGRAGSWLLLSSGHHPPSSPTSRAERRAAPPDRQPRLTPSLRLGWTQSPGKQLLLQLSSTSAPKAVGVPKAECRPSLTLLSQVFRGLLPPTLHVLLGAPLLHQWLVTGAQQVSFEGKEKREPRSFLSHTPAGPEAYRGPSTSIPPTPGGQPENNTLSGARPVVAGLSSL